VFKEPPSGRSWLRHIGYWWAAGSFSAYLVVLVLWLLGAGETVRVVAALVAFTVFSLAYFTTVFTR
jgi:hypothetical protein